MTSSLVKEGEVLESVITIRVTKEQKNELLKEAREEKRTLSNYLKIKLGLI